jgi:UDP-N-acetylmuramoyl-L-alanyl-D-glutamate--2,6-diaminopimelate ligase
MKLRDLVSEFTDVKSCPDIFIDNICHEASDCSNNSLLFYFLSHKGHQGIRDYKSEIEKAISRNVPAIILDSSDIWYDDDEIKQEFANRVYFISIIDLYKKAGLIASKFYGFPSKKLNIIAVTGTNGKTSISHFLKQSFSKLGYRAAVIGSIGYCAGDENLTTNMWTDYGRGYTTPHPLDLHRILSEFVNSGVQIVSMEVTSHSLIWYSLVGVKLTTVIFTNLTDDHLEYHGSTYNYAQAKRILFEPGLWPTIKSYIINANDRVGKGLIKKLRGYNLYPYSSISIVDKDFLNGYTCAFVKDVDLGLAKTNFNIIYRNNIYPIKTDLTGSYYVDNLLAVFNCLKSMCLSDEQILYCLNSVTKIPGRMEVFQKTNFPTFVIDFGHNLDGISKTLSTLRNLSLGKIFCIFGCSGGGNKKTRYSIAAVIEDNADEIIVTTSNPYNENPKDILSDIFEGFTNTDKVMVIENRPEAISYAFRNASDKDIVVVIGKGAQKFIAIGNKRVFHSDIEFVKSLYGGICSTINDKVIRLENENI